MRRTQELESGRRMSRGILSAVIQGVITAVLGPVVAGVLLLLLAPAIQQGFQQPSCDDPKDLTLVEPVSATASSEMQEVLAGAQVVHDAGDAIDGDSGTAWVEGSSATGNPYGRGESLTIALPDGTDLALVCVINGYAKSGDLYVKNARIRQFEVVTDAGTVIAVLPDKLAENYAHYQELRFAPGRTSSVSLTIQTVSAGAEANAQSRFLDTAVSELEFWAH